MTTARGLRNNNPGNIRHGQKWAGLADVQTDSDFCTFKSPEYGIRAICRILLTYSNRDINTVRGIVNTWAPPVENDTAAYVDDVARRCGVKPDDVLDVDQADVMRELVTAIIFHENGQNPYPRKTIDDAMRLAGIADMAPPPVMASNATKGATIAGVGTTVAAAAEGVRQLQEIQSTVDGGLGIVKWLLHFGPSIAIAFIIAGGALALYDYFQKRKRLGVG